MVQLLQSLFQKNPVFSRNWKSYDRRRYRRHQRRTMLTIQVLDDDLSAAGQTLWGMSVNISPGGIGLECEDPLNTNLLRITIRQDATSYIAAVRHRRKTESGWFVGVEFLDDDACHERL